MLTLYSLQDVDKNASTIVHKQVGWNLRDHHDVLTKEEALHSVADGQNGEFESSLICCKHPEGKVWESMFISTNRNGSSGLIATWYGKAGSRGQLVLKGASEADWYTLVKSKVIGKGYEVDSFVGRDRALMNSHQFVTDLHESAPSLPAMGFIPWQAQQVIDKGGNRAIGTLMAQAMKGITPVRNFLDKLRMNGHDLPQKIADMATPTTVPAMRDLMSGIADTLSTGTSDADKSFSRKAEPKPEINREEVYAEAWGGFA